jgi:hypothetical protein
MSRRLCSILNRRSQALTVACVILWIIVAVGTVQRSITRKMFFAPCLGTDLKLRKLKERKIAARTEEKGIV